MAKRVKDLPHFAVSSIERGDAQATGDGFKLYGTFDRVTGVRDGRCWLLLPERDCSIGDLDSFELQTGKGVFLTPEEPAQNLVGAKLPYVDGYWQAYHVWMVVEPSWRWSRKLLERHDLIAEVFESNTPQMIQGRKSQGGSELRSAAKSAERNECTRCSVAISRPRLMKSLPQAGITSTANSVGRGSAWANRDSLTLVSVGFGPCYAKYVEPHDLSFLDE